MSDLKLYSDSECTEEVDTLNKDVLYYLASPYSHHDLTIRQKRFEAVNEFAVKLAKNGIVVIEPIVTGHPKSHLMKTDFAQWEKTDKMYIDACAGGVIVLCLEGWGKSVGVSAEIAYARRTGKQVYYTYVTA